MATDGSGTDCLRGALVSSVFALVRDVEELRNERGLEADHTTVRLTPRYRVHLGSIRVAIFKVATFLLRNTDEAA